MNKFILCGIFSLGIFSASRVLAENCNIVDIKKDIFYEGPCSFDGSGRLNFGNKSVDFNYEERERQGVWSFGTLNGMPAARYEHDRESFSYATENLNFLVDVYN